MAKSRKIKQLRKDSLKRSGIPVKHKFGKLWQILLLIAIVLAIILLSINPNFNNMSGEKSRVVSEPVFKKEGVLSFYNNNTNEEIKTIDIEIAETNNERAQGLMYRSVLLENQGMLFIMNREEPQSFWMKNTYISLDIIFLDSDLRIVSIQKYTQPMSEEPVPSFKKSKYIVEVQAGFCNKYKIVIGDYIEYER